MLDRDKYQEIFSSIRKNKTRTILTGFSVATGIFMLIFLLGAGRGLRNGVKETFANNAQNSMQIFGGRTTKAYKDSPEGKFIQLNNTDYITLKRSIQKLDAISAMSYIPGPKEISYKNRFGNFNISPIHASYRKVRKLEVLQGRFLNYKDISENRKVAVIQQEVKNILFPNEEPINKYISINKIQFKVIGVFHQNTFANNHRDIFIPISVAQKIFNNNDHLNRISFALDSSTTNNESYLIEKYITQKLASSHNFSPEDKNALWIQNNIKESKKFNDIFNGIESAIWIIGVFTILLGAVGVFNIMMIVVKERTKEIGIRKAIGASPFSVINLVLLESVFITALSGYFGLIGGVGILELISRWNIVERLYPPAAMFFKDPQVDLNIAIGATLMLVIVGALAGLIPARKAASIKPIEALRDE